MERWLKDPTLIKDAVFMPTRISPDKKMTSFSNGNINCQLTPRTYLSSSRLINELDPVTTEHGTYHIRDSVQFIDVFHVGRISAFYKSEELTKVELFEYKQTENSKELILTTKMVHC